MDTTQYQDTKKSTGMPARNKKTSKLLMLSIIVFVTIVWLGLFAGSIYLWQANQDTNRQLTTKDEQIRQLEAKISDLRNTISDTSESTIVIRELGVSITLPDSINDLTYAYSSMKIDNTIVKTVVLSRASLVDANARCGLIPGSFTPLGKLSRVAGQYQDKSGLVSGNYLGWLVKQFDDFFVVYTGPQADCLGGGDAKPYELPALTESLSTIKEL